MNNQPQYNFYLTSPNQKCIVTRKTSSDKDNTYGIVNVEAACLAAKTLTDRAFKLYIRMNLNQDGFSYALSPKAMEASIGMSESKCREAVKELIATGYLQLLEKKNLYAFYEYPQKDSSLSIPQAPVDMPESIVSSPDNCSIACPDSHDNPNISEGEMLTHNTGNNCRVGENLKGSNKPRYLRIQAKKNASDSDALPRETAIPPSEKDQVNIPKMGRAPSLISSVASPIPKSNPTITGREILHVNTNNTHNTTLDNTENITSTSAHSAEQTMTEDIDCETVVVAGVLYREVITNEWEEDGKLYCDTELRPVESHSGDDLFDLDDSELPF